MGTADVLFSLEAGTVYTCCIEEFDNSPGHGCPLTKIGRGGWFTRPVVTLRKVKVFVCVRVFPISPMAVSAWAVWMFGATCFKEVADTHRGNFVVVEALTMRITP